MSQAVQSPASTSVETLEILSSGKWSASSATRFGDVFNPSTGQVIAKVPLCSVEEVGKTIEAAHAALPAWANKPVVERVRYLFKFRELIIEHAEEIARCVTREHGKTLVESRASVQRGMEVVEFACGVPSLIMGQSI